MSPLQAFIQHYWPDASSGLDYEIGTDERGQQKVLVWADTLGDCPEPEEVSIWDPEHPELSPRASQPMAALEQRQHRNSLLSMLAPANPLSKSAALERLKKLQGKTVGTQLDEIRSLLAGMFENMPG